MLGKPLGWDEEPVAVKNGLQKGDWDPINIHHYEVYECGWYSFGCEFLSEFFPPFSRRNGWVEFHPKTCSQAKASSCGSIGPDAQIKKFLFDDSLGKEADVYYVPCTLTVPKGPSSPPENGFMEGDYTHQSSSENMTRSLGSRCHSTTSHMATTIRSMGQMFFFVCEFTVKIDKYAAKNTCVPHTPLPKKPWSVIVCRLKNHQAL